MTSELRVDRITTISGLGAVDITASLAGTASLVLGSIQSASYAATASVALNAGVSASYALTASYAGTDWNVVNNKPIGLVSGSTQINTGSFTGSFSGSYASSLKTIAGVYTASSADEILLGDTRSGSFAILLPNLSGNPNPTTLTIVKLYATASLIVSGSGSAQTINSVQAYTLTNASSSIQLTSSGSGKWIVIGNDFNTIVNIPTGLVSSSVQINSGTFSGSFTGNATTATSASYAATASLLLGSITSASFATTCYTASYFSGTADFSNGLIITGSTVSTLGFTGSLQGTASLAITASYASNAGGVSSSYALTSSYASVAQNVLGSITSASYAGTASLLLGTIQSASYALTASVALNAGVSASYAVTSSIANTATSASYALNATSASYISGSVSFPSGLSVTGSIITSISGTYVSNPTLLINPLQIASITASLPFTKIYSTSSTDPTIQIPNASFTGSTFELQYSNFSAGQRTVQFQNTRKSDNALSDFSCSIAQSGSLYVKLNYLPQAGLSPASMRYMVMFTQSVI